jgi:hypothetical protein
LRRDQLPSSIAVPAPPRRQDPRALQGRVAVGAELDPHRRLRGHPVHERGRRGIGVGAGVRAQERPQRFAQLDRGGDVTVRWRRTGRQPLFPQPSGEGLAVGEKIPALFRVQGVDELLHQAQRLRGRGAAGRFGRRHDTTVSV